ncbi:MAG: hypothetical protein K9M57_09170 [Phycisphaerae bacterium]|nr:hypothetical protein [Phycisphaerae bacterium]
MGKIDKLCKAKINDLNQMSASSVFLEPVFRIVRIDFEDENQLLPWKTN